MIKYKEFIIKEYDAKYLKEVVELEKNLWNIDEKSILHDFIWKYHNNPYNKKPTAVIALSNNKVIGFRGLFSLKWKLNDEELILLSPSDAIIHPDFRRKGLYTALTNFAIDKYKFYRLFLNLSSNKFSSAASIKLSWIPVKGKKAFKKNSFAGLINIFSRKIIKRDIICKDIQYEKYSNIEVSSCIKSKDMTELARELDKDKKNVIYLVRDNDFFNWRFNNKKNKYVFYYYYNNDKLLAYLVVKVNKKDKTGIIIDYKYHNMEIFKKIVKYILNSNVFNQVKIQYYNSNNDISNIILGLGFKEINNNNLPGVLVRPIKENLTEKDWYINNSIDIRNIKSWEITGICSDSN